MLGCSLIFGDSSYKLLVYQSAAKKLFSTMFLTIFGGLFWTCFGVWGVNFVYLFSLAFLELMGLCWRLHFCMFVAGLV